MTAQLENTKTEVKTEKVVAGVATGLSPAASPTGKEKKEPKAPKGPKPALVSTPQVDDISSKKPLVVKFHCPKEQISKIEIPNPDKKGAKDIIYQLFVPLATWPARQISDKINVRSHEQNALRNPVTEKIEETIKINPFDFHLANRGITLLTHHFDYDSKNEFATLKIVNPSEEGIADGGHTDLVINKVQNELIREFTEQRDIFYSDYIASITQGNKIDFDKIPDRLRKSSVAVQIFVDLDAKERIYNLVEGRNTSRAVRPISLANFRDEFKWLEDILEKSGSEFAGKIGYEENARKKVSVLNIVSLLTLAHKIWEEKNEAPVISYSAKGKLTNVLADEKMEPGYKSLTPIIYDWLRLHDYLIVRFPETYDKAQSGKSRLARRQGVKVYNSPRALPLTGQKTEYFIPSGLIYPLMNSFRALIEYNGKGEAFFKISPFTFFDKYGTKLMSELLQNLADENNSPTQLGKKSRAYKSMYNVARTLLLEDNKPA